MRSALQRFHLEGGGDEGIKLKMGFGKLTYGNGIWVDLNIDRRHYQSEVSSVTSVVQGTMPR